MKPADSLGAAVKQVEAAYWWDMVEMLGDLLMHQGARSIPLSPKALNSTSDTDLVGLSRRALRSENDLARLDPTCGFVCRYESAFERYFRRADLQEVTAQIPWLNM